MVDGGVQRFEPKSEILLTLTAGESPPLGNIWRITSKRSDFYLDTIGATGATMHVSLHGPQGDHAGQRFHVKVDRLAVDGAREAGHFVEHLVPRRGRPFTGRQVGEHAYQVARLRWRWDLQRPRYRAAAVFGNAPEISEGQSGRRMQAILNPNSAWDVDVFISYDQPFWPMQTGTAHGHPRLGPVRNEAGHWLTACSVVRSQVLSPSPDHLVPRLPNLEETPNRLTCGGHGHDGDEDLYWFVETITARELLEDWAGQGR